ncbi:TPA: hypothetical protein ACSPKR_004261, partial [Providencia rettgeri]
LCSSAFSAPVGNLKVAGDIKQPTCNINGGNDEVIFDYGQISPSLLKQNVATPFYVHGNRIKNLSVSCDAATFLTFVTTESYPLKSYSFYPSINLWPDASKWLYGVVDTQTGKEVGAAGGLHIDTATATVDGRKAYVSFVSTGVDSSSMLVKNQRGGWTKTNQGGTTVTSPSGLNLAPGKLFSLDINAPGLYLKSVRDLTADGVDISNGIDFIGQIVMTFNFGV